MQRTNVAIGIIIRERQILICRRKPKGHFGGFWEFPGGKCEGDESPASCVVRELREELAIEVRPIEQLDPVDYDYPHLRVRLYPFLCRLVEGEPRLIECVAFEWADPHTLSRYQFPPANEPLLRTIIARLSYA